VVLASDVTGAGAGVDRLLFGTLVGLTGADLAAGGASAVLALAACASLGRAWLARGFDPEGAAGLGPRGEWVDFALLAVVAACVVAALPAVGALLVASLFVVPAVTARLLTRSVAGLLTAAVAVALVQGLVGLYIAYWLDASPGPAVAATGAAGYGVVALLTAARTHASARPRRVVA
jgi:ABC-type Mn2+/Zn2+ transport system permease subunit